MPAPPALPRDQSAAAPATGERCADDGVAGGHAWTCSRSRLPRPTAANRPVARLPATSLADAVHKRTGWRKAQAKIVVPVGPSRDCESRLRDRLFSYGAFVLRSVIRRPSRSMDDPGPPLSPTRRRRRTHVQRSLLQRALCAARRGNRGTVAGGGGASGRDGRTHRPACHRIIEACAASAASRHRGFLHVYSLSTKEGLALRCWRRRCCGCPTPPPPTG